MTENNGATGSGSANAWAGPALFTVVAVVMLVFFYWFLS